MTKTTQKAGFTLIEVMSAMAILALLVAMLAQMFTVATDSVKRGEGELSRNSAAQLGMETLLQSIEGMVVNDRTACYFHPDAGDASGFGLDEAWFVTTSTVMGSSNNVKKSYELVRFSVEENTHTNTTGMVYLSYDLMYSAMAITTTDRSPQVEDKLNWWEDSYIVNTLNSDMNKQVLIPNVVRFDFYLVGWDAENAMNEKYEHHYSFSSTTGGNDGIKGVPPAMIDIYIQVAGDESAVEGGSMLYAAQHGGGSDLETRGREILVRDSVVYFGRALPVCGPARYLEAISGKPHHYYVDED
ncbi:MAG: prepilin-type N-terminal cleavage/methylation domain-containing protein [Kiritimatiellae bacterium]|nr:prepilin-type N-terminal cleavage/methylation domain-containing protein [Kiritimatiellia bacterium]